MKKKGFTLVELLAVIAILAILVIMALPAVLRMFTQARIDTFNNELNTLIRTTRQQYLLTGGQAATYSKDSNPLSLTGNSELNYCITINGQGQITELKATNGSYKYESNGIVSETSSSDILDAESGYTLSCSGGSSSSLTYINRQNAGSITIGDEVAIDTEHFYVVSSNSTNTVLLAKYNLYVGRIYNESSNTYTEISPSENGYGLQNENAKGWVNGDSQCIGLVPFSGSSNTNGYWDSTGSGIASKYGTYTYYANNIYDVNYTSAPNYNVSFINNEENANYSIAYYVEEYLNRLGANGLGRLLTYAEEQTLASSNSAIVFNGTHYWLGSVGSSNSVMGVRTNAASGNVYGMGFTDKVTRGVRPVIEVPTSDMPN